MKEPCLQRALKKHAGPACTDGNERRMRLSRRAAAGKDRISALCFMRFFASQGEPMSVSLCIHGHFYQPPREDPWLGSILTEASAAPMRHWNERILRESYAPLAWARRLNADGKITDILNCYEWISFNVGPTLLRWLQEAAPEVLERMKQGDANSRKRWGHGNAMAQIYHHVIMPLASEEDKMLETRWAIDDFRFHFGREPEGMWLSECAADVPTLEILAAQGIRFVVLAPQQARAVIADGKAVPVSEANLNIGEPYRVSLPSGAAMTVIFYHGALSQAIAFESLLGDGEHFWQRISGEAAALGAKGGKAPLLTLATDGETYGHHFTFGEMALAYALAQGYARRDGIRLTNLAAHIAANPPTREVLLHEPSSWSCAHGVERWRSDCGCTGGGHPGWNQQWRGPLRDALALVRGSVIRHFALAGKDCFTDPAAALAAYGSVLANADESAAFAATWFTGTAASHDKAWKLLAMQEQSLASFASCAWFFDDIARIEPENALTFALRSMDLLRDTGGPDMTPGLLDILAKARSNQPEAGSGEDLFLRDVLPRRDDPATLCLLAWLLAAAQGAAQDSGAPFGHAWPDAQVTLVMEEEGENGVKSGTAAIKTRHEQHGARYRWRLEGPSPRCLPGRPFRSLADAVMHVCPEEKGDAVWTSRRAADCSRPMRGYLQTACLEQDERRRRPELLALAAHAASLSDPWIEAQHDIPRPELWSGLLPYLAVNLMCNEALDEQRRESLYSLLAMGLSAQERTLAGRMASAIFSEALLNRKKVQALPLSFPCDTKSDEILPRDSAVDDALLAVWARRLRRILPDMDWWAVQNALWETGSESFPAFAEELHFRC